MFWLIVAATFNIREKKKERRDFEVDLADRRHDSRLELPKTAKALSQIKHFVHIKKRR